MKSIICFNINGDLKPFAKLIESNIQIIIALIELDGEHLTVHKKRNSDNFMFTYSDKNKLPRTWDESRIELARKLVSCQVDKVG